MDDVVEIFDKDGNPLKLSNVIRKVLDEHNDVRSENMVMIGLRGYHNETACLYYIRPIGYEPHMIDVLKDL
jgi:hypothetical protein